MKVKVEVSNINIVKILIGKFGYSQSSRSPETQEKKKASEFLDMFGINCRKDFLSWSIKNHPDKGGKEDVFKRVSNWVDICF